MNTSSHHNRVPQGLPTGGQFAPTSHLEPALSLADPSTRPLNVSPGETEDYTELADGEVIERLAVSRSEDDHRYWVAPAKTIDFHQLLTPKDLGTNVEGRDAWLEKHSLLIENFMVERYDAEMHGNDEDWSSVEVEFDTVIPDGLSTEGAAADTAWNQTKIVELHSESDHGSYGCENLGRLIRERVEASTSVENFYGSRGAAMRMNSDELEAHINDRTGTGEISDAAAMALAKRFATGRRPPAMLSLSINSHAGTNELLEELDASLDGADPQHIRRAAAMRSWIRQGANK